MAGIEVVETKVSNKKTKEVILPKVSENTVGNVFDYKAKTMSQDDVISKLTKSIVSVCIKKDISYVSYGAK